MVIRTYFINVFLGKVLEHFCAWYETDELPVALKRQLKKHLLLRSKAMTNLDIILKNRGITSPTKVHTVKAMVFPVVMYRCERWK